MNLKNSLPIIRTDTVYHLGLLDPARRGERGRSQEGHCLSVSRCPDAWLQIAKLGSKPLWELKRAGGRFLDMHRVQEDPELRKQIEGWGIQNGYAARSELWQAWQFDSEADEWRFTLQETREKALAEVDAEGGDIETAGPEGRPLVNPVHILVGSPELGSRVGIPGLHAEYAFDYVAMTWVEAVHPDLDGVWWDDAYNPANLTAPRGGIFPSKVGAWQPTLSTGVEDDVGSDGLVFDTLEKRVWVYVLPPAVFDVAPCDCGNAETQWSEYENHLWCSCCEKDFIPAHAGVFDGPIPVRAAAMLGITFDRVNLETKEIERFDLDARAYLPGQKKTKPVP